MHFDMPHFPCSLEIPNDWLTEAGFPVLPQVEAYRSSTVQILVPFTEVEPPPRFHRAPLDFHGFSRERIISVLKGFVSDNDVEAVALNRLPILDYPVSPYKF
jgi:hypothetical protein